MGTRPVDTALADAGPPGEDGWRVLRLPVESVRHACWLLLRMGASLEVLGPPELREMMASTVSELAAVYGAGVPASLTRPALRPASYGRDLTRPAPR